LDERRTRTAHGRGTLKRLRHEVHEVGLGEDTRDALRLGDDETAVLVLEHDSSRTLNGGGRSDGGHLLGHDVSDQDRGLHPVGDHTGQEISLGEQTDQTITPVGDRQVPNPTQGHDGPGDIDLFIVEYDLDLGRHEVGDK
jgi:hypothetical protein